MSIVIIAEKPSVAQDIASVLGVSKKTDHYYDSPDLKITWASGHLLGLKMLDDYDPKFKDWQKSVEDLPYIPKQFQFQPEKRTKKQLDAILKLIKEDGVQEIVNACDAAREGELIFRRIIEFANLSKKISRMWIQSMTPKAISQAFESRKDGSEYQSLSDAAYARSEADWIIGMNGTRIANKHLPRRKGQKVATSLGRVQTATLAMIVDHELEVLSHIPEPYWQLHATFAHKGGSWTGKWSRSTPTPAEQKQDRIYEPSEKQTLESILQNNSSVSVDEITRTKNERPPLNLDLTNLQKKTNSLWSWTSTRTSKVAQDLYDSFKLITYPRTDSQYLPEDMKDTIVETIQSLSQQNNYKQYSKNLISTGLVNQERNFNSSKVSDHFAIIPTGEAPKAKLSGDHLKLYDFIVRNFLASWYAESEWSVVKRIATIENEVFSKEVEILTTPGWREVIPKNNTTPDDWFNLNNLPEQATVSSFEFSEETTKPKPRLKEAGVLSLMQNAGKILDDDEFVEAMKDKGLGTPATRNETIDKLVEKTYIRRSKSSTISATAHGIQLIDILRRIPIEWITSAELTGEMEASLISVQRGKLPKSDYMGRIIEQTGELVSKIRNHDRSTLYQSEDSVGSCLLCGQSIIETTMSYQCEANIGKGKGCEFVIWKDSSGRWYDKTTVKRLLHDRQISNLHGFFNFSGEQYEMDVKLEHNGRVSALNSTTELVSNEDIEIASCRMCSNGTIRKSSTSYQCDNKDCKFRGMQKIMCHREISTDEAKVLFQTGKSELFDDFISKKNTQFSAYLIIKGNGIRYEFPLRTKNDELPKFQIAPGVVALCPVHKSEIVETETHFQITDHSGECRIQIARQISGRELTREEAKVLIESKEVGPFEDFTSKAGKPFAAVIYIKKNESIGYKFAKRS
ncbi:MAG: DNA topoisomerase [archaeon]|nr:DNA topoisomerase [archaeon]